MLIERKRHTMLSSGLGCLLIVVMDDATKHLPPTDGAVSDITFLCHRALLPNALMRPSMIEIGP